MAPGARERANSAARVETVACGEAVMAEGSGSGTSVLRYGTSSVKTLAWKASAQAGWWICTDGGGDDEE
eukprot:3336585-Rhodomonas_salina.1